ncbi:vegetative cell wall protein gp1-like [Numida meleagris]|uniref:vegetative cell wall protein gp1-like n=1 Tax=Numida meleagris TaxID=8996 RepID=UPI000B3E4051|nr:vegetative cell wall protein gp1-like [Numida meleagris]
MASGQGPAVPRWIPISSNPTAAEEPPPSSIRAPVAERDPKASPEERPMEERDHTASPAEEPTVEPPPGAPRWIPVSSNGDPEMKRDPTSSSGDPTPAPDPKPTPVASNRGPRAAAWDPVPTNKAPAVEPDPEQLRSAEWDPTPPMEEDRDPATHGELPVPVPNPAPHGERPEAEDTPLSPAVEAMLAAVAASPVRVRSQQQGDPELTAAERHRELRALFLRKPLVFLERFHGALGAEHLPCFVHLPPRYEVAFYCRQVRGRRQQNPENGATRWPRRPGARTRLRNRRYAALRQLIAGVGREGGPRGGNLWDPEGPCRVLEGLVGSLSSLRGLEGS